ncbi:hypothetical protein HDU76_013708 [Blyttiomyces sp. JEL0837]|nr:hypothetical protein HDU76_013708 [Blyttiomyces sp. JEL0837]
MKSFDSDPESTTDEAVRYKSTKMSAEYNSVGVGGGGTGGENPGEVKINMKQVVNVEAAEHDQIDKDWGLDSLMDPWTLLLPPKLEEIYMVETISSKTIIVGIPGPEFEDSAAVGDEIIKLIQIMLKKLSRLTAKEDKMVKQLYAQTLAETGRSSVNVQRKIKVGVSYGPVVAGIVGEEKFCYDIYGDTVK